MTNYLKRVYLFAYIILVISCEKSEESKQPIASFSADKTSAGIFENVNFIDETLNNPVRWSWDFGDGSTSTEQNPTHTYEVPGDYSVSLTALNYSGSSNIAISNYIAVSAQKKDSITDIDGNTYQTIKIGDYWWMADNLRTTRYKNGDSIPLIADTMEWYWLESEAYMWSNYIKTELDRKHYGALYKGYAALGDKICPSGWHVPTDDDWKNLEMALGIPYSELEDYKRGTNEGSKMAGYYDVWKDNYTYGLPSLILDDQFSTSGFNAYPAGAENKGFYYHNFCAFGTASEFDSISYYTRNLYVLSTACARSYRLKKEGCSIRCVKD